MGLNPLESGHAFREAYEASHGFTSCMMLSLNPLESGHAFRVLFEERPSEDGIQVCLNPLESGHAFRVVARIWGN